MKNNKMFLDQDFLGYPKALLLSAKELDSIRKGGKICLISLAAGSGHKTMAATVKKLMLERYKGFVTEDTFIDPNNSAEGHPGVWLWNRWQKSENVNSLMVMVHLQKIVDKIHHLGVRLWLPRTLQESKAIKVIDVQTNSTLSICQAIGDYNDLLAGKKYALPLYMRFVYGLVDLDYRIDNIFWRGVQDFWLKKCLATIFYIPCFVAAGAVRVVTYPLSVIFSLVRSFWSSDQTKPVPKFSFRGPIDTVKVLTDVPVYDESNRADSTVNYFNALTVLSDQDATRSNLKIISPPIVSHRGTLGAVPKNTLAGFENGCEEFFANPFPEHLRKRVYFSEKKDFLVRDSFKLSKKELDNALLADPEAKKLGYVVDTGKSKGKTKLNLSRDPDTLYVSVMLGGNGGVSLERYTNELAGIAKNLKKLKNQKGKSKIHLTVFCGGSEEVFQNITNRIMPDLGPESQSHFKVEPLQRVQDKVIAGIINRSHVHVTRPGGISTFELDAMRRSGTLTDTKVLFHTPWSVKNPEGGNAVPNVDGLLPWERSNALWFMANRYGVPSTNKEMIRILTDLHGKPPSDTVVASLHNLDSKEKILREGLGQCLVSDETCRYNALVHSRLEGDGSVVEKTCHRVKASVKASQLSNKIKHSYSRAKPLQKVHSNNVKPVKGRKGGHGGR